MRYLTSCLAVGAVLFLATFGTSSCSISSGAGGGAGSGGTGGSAGSGGTGGAFSVASLPGLVMWLDASKGITGTTSVSAWADQSGNGNNATASGSMPALVASSIHSLPAVSFTAQSMQTADSATLGMGTGEFLFEVVARVNSLGSQLFSVSAGPTSLARLFISATGGLPTAELLVQPVTLTATGTTAAADNQARLFGLRRTIGTAGTAMLEVRVNGSAQGSRPVSLDLGSTMAATVGGPDAVVEIAEVVVVQGTTSERDLAALESFLKTKYGL